MPSEGFLQRFHDLAEADADFRCKTAVALRQELAGGCGEQKDVGSLEEDLQYAIRRLVRGVQSSRQCCRQGFSLALSELLVEHPSELGNVLQLIRQHTGLQTGLRSGELKERLLGRIFAYSAVLEAGCLRSSAGSGSSSAKGRKPQAAPVSELGAGLHEVFASRQYLRAPAAFLQVQVCRDLCDSGQAARVPEVLEGWSIDAKIGGESGSDDGKLDVYAAGIALELRLAYVDAEEAGNKDALKAWPVCARKDSFAKPAALTALARAFGQELVGSPVSDATPFAVGSFCRWLLHAVKTRDVKTLQGHVWPILDEVLFPEGAAAAAQAQGLRGFGEFAACLQEAGASCGGPQAEMLLVGFFECMQRGLKLLFQMLGWQTAHTHAAAVFAQTRLAEAAGAPSSAVQLVGKAKKKKKKNTKAAPAVEAPRRSEWKLSDNTRLAILAALQRYKGFGTMKNAFQRQWQQALVTPLSTTGIRARCSSLFAGLVAASATQDTSQDAGGGNAADPISARICADQLVQLATHGHAPDEVILAVLCLLLTAAYFEPVGDSARGAGYPLGAFRESVGLAISAGGADQDLMVPVLTGVCVTNDSARGDDGKGGGDAAHWRGKFWSALTGLVKRTSPETAEKHLAAAGGGEALELRTLAFHGHLSDGSLWLIRLHQWWDYVLERPPRASGAASPRVSPKKKRRNEGASLRLVAALGEDDLALRKRCQELCAEIMKHQDGELAMPRRQINALCSLPLALAFGLLQTDDDVERQGVSESLRDVVDALGTTVELYKQGAAGKKKKALQQRNDALAVVPRIACELFVDANSLVREAARVAWRELGEFASDETLTSLCSSVCDGDDVDKDEGEEAEDANKKDEGHEDEDSDDEDAGGDGPSTAAKVARMARFARATVEARAAADNGEGDDDEDGVVLGSDEVWEQLLGDGDAAEGSLLAAFASSGLDDPDAAGSKQTKRQKRLRQRQEELLRKFRELELLELFVQRFVDKRPVATTILQQLFQALLAAGRRATGAGRSVLVGSGEGGGIGSKRIPKVDAQVRKIEADLSKRLGDVLSKALKQTCRWSVVGEVRKWYPQEEWSSKARALFAAGQGPQAAAAGQRPAEVGAVLLYWLCTAHRACMLAGEGPNAGNDEANVVKGWDLAEELLAEALKSWSCKRDCERWCAAIFSVFANRAPRVLVSLPWLAQIREGRNAFVQRAQLTLVTNQILRNLPSSSANANTATFASDVAVLCADLLEGTLAPPSDKAPSASSSQRQKLRRDVLKALNALLKIQKRHAPGEQKPRKCDLFDVAISTKIVAIVKKVTAALPVRRGEVYSLCLFIQRALRVGDEGYGAKKSLQQEQQKRHRQDDQDVPQRKVKRRRQANDDVAGSGEGQN